MIQIYIQENLNEIVLKVGGIVQKISHPRLCVCNIGNIDVYIHTLII
jgi:hypothetical protein